MTSRLCPTAPPPFDWSDACVRTVWSTFAPATLVVLFCICRAPFPAPLRKITSALKSPFASFLTLQEAEAYDVGDDDETKKVQVAKERAPLWLTSVLIGAALLEMCVWVAVTVYNLVVGRPTLPGFMMGAVWLYSALKPAIVSKSTPHYNLFALYLVNFLGSFLVIGGAWYAHSVYLDPLPPSITLVSYVCNSLLLFALLIVQASRPLALPSARVNKNDVGKTVSPEDYTSLWGWVSFSWVSPLVRNGTHRTLNEDDVWKMSSTLATRPVFLKFTELKRKSLVRQLWASNSKDILLDFLLTFLSVLFNYAGPFFLKRIIDSFDPSAQPEQRGQAYIYACLMFCTQVLKSEADAQHLWFGRRAATRIRAELMSAIYDKSLKRKDFSGIVSKDETDSPKAGADVGKIVNLMAGDASRIASLTSDMYSMYGAPFEIVIASVFLYQLLGFSAFAGFIALLLAWPLNSLLSSHAVRVSTGLFNARDKRMGVLNELIGAVKFIKFFAWEDQWIARALAVRKNEIDWLIKMRVNNILFQLLWTTAPILVSIIAFFAYVVQGYELTVGTAFTAIALFNMIRQPLNVIPEWIVEILQARVSLQRIESFLNEDEVDEQVSTIKRTQLGASAPSYDMFGLENASFKWNAVEKESLDKNNENMKTDVNAKLNVGGGEANGGSGGSAHSPDMEANVSTLAGDSDYRRFELKNISLTFPDGELSVVTGPTASGKTALLLSLLGEMTLTHGKILMSKEPEKVDEHGLTHGISYAAQTPWLQHQSIKENILFGSPYDEARYKDVLECCALLPDLEILEDGDETEIGVRGVSLSGGQKARVALARAVYARTKYVLLDDPLSAVDSHTARFLYERLFLGPLMRHRTVVLVTHHVELVLPGTHYLVRMLDGRIDIQGTVKDLRVNGQLDHITLEAAVEAQEEEETGAVEEKSEIEAEIAAVETSGADGSQEAGDKNKKKPRKMIKDEERETGGVKWIVYKTYLKASSYWAWALVFGLVICTQILNFSEKYWIKVWGEAYGEDVSTTQLHVLNSNNGVKQQSVFSDLLSPYHVVQLQANNIGVMGLQDRLPSPHDKPLFYVFVYALIGFSTAGVVVLSDSAQFFGAIRASRRLFKQLLETVVRATMRWHDVTPAGRILNRFSKDISTIDMNLAISLQDVNSSLASFISSMVVVIVVFPPFIVPAVIIGYFYYVLAIGYLNTGRDLRRMESTSRSPIVSGFRDLLEGIVTVRAFSAESRFMNGLFKKIDLTQRMLYFFWMTNRWLLLRYDLLGALAVFITSLFTLSVNPMQGGGQAGWAALCITSAMAFTNNIYLACRSWTQLELDMNSVERVVEYLDLPQEPPAVIENSRPPAHWPTSTGPNADSLVVVEDLEVRYAPDLPAVLHGVSFALKARERVGILGRTGSGKSTLAMSILRFVDPSKGKITIDGIDIATIGIHDLRSRLTFIPQDATLFSGSLRENLDPFGDYSDVECLDALHRVHLISDSSYNSQRSSAHDPLATSIHERVDTDTTTVTSPSFRTPSDTVISATSSIAELDHNGSASHKGGPPKITLETEVSAGGLNFSAGQRQLIAMARALLHQSAVIVLDEATSSIDFETDSKIQKTIREEFQGSLLLTIAHRLRTVIDYDRLIVLDAGRIAEFDTPYNLIQKEGGIFRGMCMKSGSFSELEAAAKEKIEQDAKIPVQDD